jgi:DNA-binding NarL/FixJ family response regulator
VSALASAPKPRALDPTACRFVLIEDDVLLRDLLKAQLVRTFAPRALDEFQLGKAGLDACLAAPPEILITDLRLPDLDGRDIIRRLRAKQVPTRIIVLTTYVDAVLPAELIALGVAGLVDKLSSLDHVERALISVLSGGLYFAASVSPIPTTPSSHPGIEDEVGPGVLSERERTMARLIAQGLRSKEIADQLELNPRTAEKHRLLLLEKLKLPNTISLVRWCVRHGLD